MDLGASWVWLVRLGCVLVLLATSSAAAASSDIAKPPGAIDDRGYELVSQAAKNSFQVAQLLPISSDGTHALYALFAGGAPGSTSGQGVFAATRTPAGWRSHNALPSRSSMPAGTYVLGAASEDLSHWIGSAMEGVGSSDQAPDVSVARLNDSGGQELLRTFPRFFGVNGVPVVTSSDMEHVLAAVPRGADPALPGYAPGDVLEEDSNVFDLGSGTPQLVSAMPGGNAPPSCGVDGHGGAMEFPGGSVNGVSEHWISDDGTRAFFGSKGDICTNPRQLYLRDLAAGTTALVSGPVLTGDPDNGVDRFLQATPDGALAFFRTATSYDPADDADGSASDRDIYRWNASTGALTCITCGVPGANVPLATSTRFANAVIAENGSHVYFPSAVQAADAPAPGTATEPNLYVWRAGDESTHYIGRLTVAGGNGLANVPYVGGQATPDGDVLIFRSRSAELDALSATSNGHTYQYYRYDDRDRSLTCVSCPPAATPSADVPFQLAGAFATLAVAPRVRAVTDDGSMVFFPTQDTLVADDVNHTWDIYEWHDGVVRLITNGLTRYPGSTQPYAIGASANGRDFLFQDPAPLTWEARDSSYQVYDARIGGGFPRPAPQPSCDGDPCQGPPPPPQELAAPASEALRGSHNLAAPARLTVRRPTAAQRARLARTGRIALSVRVPRAGTLSVLAQARLGARIRGVGHASRHVRAAGAVRISLRLAAAARAHLRRSGRLRLVLAVELSPLPTGQRLSLVLTRPGRAR